MFQHVGRRLNGRVTNLVHLLRRTGVKALRLVKYSASSRNASLTTHIGKLQIVQELSEGPRF